MMAKLWYARKAAPLYKDPEYMMIVSTFYVKLFPARILGLPGKVHTRMNCILGFKAYFIFKKKIAFEVDMRARKTEGP